ncbi:DNA polymerase III subunit beta [Salinisphaera orenii]|uniref:Beta sliding clamp n=1 Tax=Salinisphaera orenii YIM 95161 TaxID=1051139 RepID=A0A423PJF6_9GAMM|nr:DNA polymerase III subunit beta [Salinisphaera halophila]ROO25729.1 DNA polymerase III subunit beta [Salinisphaera halophila YIM 95161]
MQFSIQRRDLLSALQTVIGVVERRQTMPILSNVLFKADNDRLVLTATDLELELITECSAVVGQPGSAAVPARKLLDICRGLPDDAEVQLSQEQQQTRVQSGRSRFTLATLSAQDWPHLDEVEAGDHFTIPENTLRGLLERTHFAMAHQDVRYYLNGLLLALRSDRLRCVATDGHRLALSDAEATIDIEEPTQAIIPRKAITELVRLLDNSDAEISIQLSSKHLRLQLPGLVFTTKLIDGRFPDYERVIPTDVDKIMAANRDVIRQALSRTAILSNEKFGGVRLALSEHTLRLQAQNVEREEAEDELQVSYDNQPMEIGFNVNYLLEALGAMRSEEFTLSLSGPDSSGLLQATDDPSTRYVVMPMRL